MGEEVMNQRIWVISPDGKDPLFCGTESEVTAWLEVNKSEEPRGIYVTATGDELSESEFLDLAS